MRGTYVWIMDDDDVAIPDGLARHVELLEARPEVGFTYASQVTACSTPRTNRISPGTVVELPEITEDELFVRLMEDCFIPHPALVARRRCYLDVGPFNEVLVRSQDYEMVLRLSRRFRGAPVNGPTYYHRVHRRDRGSAAMPLSAEDVP